MYACGAAVAKNNRAAQLTVKTFGLTDDPSYSSDMSTSSVTALSRKPRNSSHTSSMVETHSDRNLRTAVFSNSTDFLSIRCNNTRLSNAYLTSAAHQAAVSFSPVARLIISFQGCSLPGAKIFSDSQRPTSGQPV